MAGADDEFRTGSPSPSRNCAAGSASPEACSGRTSSPWIYLGATALVVIAAIFSGRARKPLPNRPLARHEPPQPTIQDNTDNNVQDLKNQLAAERQKEAQAAAAAAPQTPNASLADATPPSRQLPRRTGPNGQALLVYAGPAVLATADYAQQHFLLSTNRRSNWRQRSGNWLMIRDLHRILSIRARRDAPAEPRSDVTAHADTGAPTTLNQAAPDQPGSSMISARQSSEQKSSPLDQPSTQAKARGQYRLGCRPAICHL